MNLLEDFKDDAYSFIIEKETKYITKLITEKGIIDANSSSINKLKN